MFAIIGIVIVFGSVIAGFLMEHGQLAVLFQPAELVTIGGAALGTIFIGNPMHVVIGIGKGLAGAFSGSKYTKAYYLETLKMLNQLFSYARKEGMVKLEADVEEPKKSPVLSKYPKFLKDHHATDFICDTLRMSISGGIQGFDLDQMMELDIEVHHHQASLPVTSLNTVADALPGLGIVAAVLGIVVTMGSLGGPPEEIGKKVAAALVGTFLGILLCYGLFGPLAASMTKTTDAESDFYKFLRVAVVSFVKGFAPILAVEFARRCIPNNVRPTFKEMEDHCKGKSGASAPEAPAKK